MVAKWSPSADGVLWPPEMSKKIKKGMHLIRIHKCDNCCFTVFTLGAGSQSRTHLMRNI